MLKTTLAKASSTKVDFTKVGAVFQTLSIQKLHFIFLCAIVLILYNVGSFAERINTHNLPQYLVEILVHFCLLVGILVFFSFNTLVLKAVAISLTAFATVGSYAKIEYGITLDAAMIANLLHAAGHAKDISDVSMVYYTFLLFLVPAFFICVTSISKTPIKWLAISFIISVLCIASVKNVMHHKFINNAVIAYYPVNIVAALVKYYQRFHASINNSKGRTPVTELFPFSYEGGENNLKVVLIIGESLRADHLGINGYHRDTTPTISGIPNFSNMILQAAFNNTMQSVVSMLSHRTKKEHVDIPQDTSVVSVFRNFGFDTAWYSAQSSSGQIAKTILYAASEAKDYFFRDRLRSYNASGGGVYDDALLPFLEKSLAQAGKQFVVLHTFGNHMKFHERYTKEYERYTPACRKSATACEVDALVNSYDNSILYTDHIVSEVIAKVQDYPAIVFFVGDHGFFLGEGGIYASGSATDINEPAHQVPMFVYTTDMLREHTYYKQKIENLRLNANGHFSHDNVFDTLLDCSGFESTLFKRGMSLCSFQPPQQQRSGHKKP